MTVCALWVVVSALVEPAGAEDNALSSELPADLPPYGADKPLPVPDIQQVVLKNGMNVWVVPRDGPPMVTAVLAVRSGRADDPADRPGQAELLADLLTEGTGEMDARTLAESLQAIGGAIDTNASTSGTWILGSAFASQTRTLLSLVAAVATDATIPDAEFELARANALQGLSAADARPDVRAERAIARAVFGDHPYGTIDPTAASLEAATAQELREVYRARFRPDRALLVVVGPVKAGKVKGWSRSAFKGWRAEGEAPKEVPAVADDHAPKLWTVDRKGSVQSAIRIGAPGVAATHADATALDVANALLGGGFASRIVQNIREDKGYTYSPGSSVRRYGVGGSVVVRADVRNEVTGAAINEIFYELDRLGTTPVGAAELDRAKRYTAGLVLYRNQRQGGLAGTLANNWIVGLPPAALERYVPDVLAVTADDVREVARRYYRSRAMSVVVVGDTEAIGPELSQYGAFETVE